MSRSPDYVVSCVLSRLAEMSRRQVSAASLGGKYLRSPFVHRYLYIATCTSLCHRSSIHVDGLDIQYLAHPFDGMCDVVVPPCFPLCYIGTLCGLANSPICQHPLCCYSPPQSIDRAHFGDARLRWRVFWRFPSETPCCLFVYVDRTIHALFLRG